MPATLETKPDSAAQLDLLMPLQFFYSQDEAPLPFVEFLAGDQIPEPARHLLVHDSDMTPKLRAFHQCPIGLTVIAAEMTDQFVMRQVVLTGDSGRPVEYGAIGIQLEGLPESARRKIRGGTAPLGAILEEEEIPHQSAPRGFFKLVADEHIAQLLHCVPGARLYGRCNALTFPDGIVFADIVEILPPA